MPQTRRQIQDDLAALNLRPRRQFGQNFMIDANLVRCVADAGELSPTDLVIEIGPGTGALTEELLGRGVKVVAVEIDRGLAALLQDRFASNQCFHLIEADALASKHALCPDLLAAIQHARSAGRPVKLVANLPYNVASPLLVELLIAGIDLLAFTVQKEVAARLRATPSTEAYGALSVVVQLLADVELLRTLPPQAFWPAPKVESALVRLCRHDRLHGRARHFGEFVQKLFSYRRKMLRRSLAGFCGDPAGMLARLKLAPESRPEELDPETLLRLFSAL